MNHQINEIVNHLSAVVALFDQKNILSDQDIRSKEEILKMIRRLTSATNTRKNPMTINELLSMILEKLKVQNLLHLRLICNQWKSAIEAICAQKHSLRLYSFVDQSQNTALSNRSFGTIKPQQFVELKLKCLNDGVNSFHNPLKESFCTLLGNTFPRVNQLRVELELNSNSTKNLHNMMQNWWPNLNTLSMSNLTLDLGTFHRINKLKRLDLCGRLDVAPNPQMIAHLEHFSCALIRSIDKLPDRMPQLRPNCTSFWWAFNFSGGTPLPFDQWIQPNTPHVLANITHLGLFIVEQPVVSTICANFPALQMLDIGYFKIKYSFNNHTCAELAKLSHLTTLSLGRIKFDLDSLERPEQTKRLRLPLIRMLNLVQFKIRKIDNAQFDGDRFCRNLASVFPNVEKLDFSSSDVVNSKILDNLKNFGRSLKFRTPRSKLIVNFISSKN